MKHFEVAIVGAGIAGLAAARALDTQNYMIFEKVVGLAVGWRRNVSTIYGSISVHSFLRPVNHAFRQSWVMLSTRDLLSVGGPDWAPLKMVTRRHRRTLKSAL